MISNGLTLIFSDPDIAVYKLEKEEVVQCSAVQCFGGHNLIIRSVGDHSPAVINGERVE